MSTAQSDLATVRSKPTFKNRPEKESGTPTSATPADKPAPGPSSLSDSDTKPRLELRIDQRGKGEVLVDGNDIANICKYISIYIYPDQRVKVHLEIAGGALNFRADEVVGSLDWS